jgi:hypothetical protein
MSSVSTPIADQSPDGGASGATLPRASASSPVDYIRIAHKPNYKHVSRQTTTRDLEAMFYLK